MHRTLVFGYAPFDHVEACIEGYAALPGKKPHIIVKKHVTTPAEIERLRSKGFEVSIFEKKITRFHKDLIRILIRLKPHRVILVHGDAFHQTNIVRTLRFWFKRLGLDLELLLGNKHRIEKVEDIDHLLSQTGTPALWEDFGFGKSTKQTLTPVSGAFPGKETIGIEHLSSHRHYGHICLENVNIYLQKKGAVEEWILRRIGRGKRILDTGCADGKKAELIARQGNEVFGIEVWPDVVEAADRRPGVKAFRVDMNCERFPFECDFFDAIYASDVYEHLLDWDHYLSECRRVLKPGGRIYLVTPNRFPLGDIWKLLAGTWEWKFNDYRLWTAGMVRRSLELWNFEVQMYPDIVYPQWISMLGYLFKNLPFHLSRFRRIGITAVGTKRSNPAPLLQMEANKPVEEFGR